MEEISEFFLQAVFVCVCPILSHHHCHFELGTRLGQLWRRFRTWWTSRRIFWLQGLGWTAVDPSEVTCHDVADFARVPNMTKGNGSMKASVKRDGLIFAKCKGWFHFCYIYKWQFQVLAAIPVSVKAVEALLAHDFLAWCNASSCMSHICSQVKWKEFIATNWNQVIADAKELHPEWQHVWNKEHQTDTTVGMNRFEVCIQNYLPLEC